VSKGKTPQGLGKLGFHLVNLLSELGVEQLPFWADQSCSGYQLSFPGVAVCKAGASYGRLYLSEWQRGSISVVVRYRLFLAS